MNMRNVRGMIQAKAAMALALVFIVLLLCFI
jgi:hypothetical protein